MRMFSTARVFARLALLGLLLVVATAACTSEGDQAREDRDNAQKALATQEGGVKAATATPTATGTAAATTAPAGGGGGSGANIAVDLKEWAVAPNPAQGGPGSTTFTAKNTGAIPHELVVLKTDTAPDRLEQRNGQADESKAQVIGRTEQFNAGEEKRLTVNMAAGKYVLICNVVGHYQLGMRTGFEVK